MKSFLLACVLSCLVAHVLSASYAPLYVHLALTDDTTQMSVGWYTQDNSSYSMVQWGTSSSSMNNVNYGNSNQWKEGYGFNHFAVMTGLAPQQRYYYQVGSNGAKGGWSPVYSFLAAPDTLTPFTIGVYGDMGTDNVNNTLNRILQRTADGDWDWIFHLGDISYADDHVMQFQETWNKWFDYVNPITPIMPYMVAPGNHEYTSYDPKLIQDTINFKVYNARFYMPYADSDSKNMYYSFDYSYVHFVVYSTETSFDGAPYGDPTDYGNEMAWLENDLAKANQNRENVPWIIVIGHRPIYSSCDGFSEDGTPTDEGFNLSATLQAVFEPIFYAYGVDMILNGHVHSYERNYPTYNNTVTNTDYYNAPSPFNIVIGCAGNIEGLEDGDPSNWQSPEPVWSAYRFGSDYGYAILSVYNETTLNWQFYSSSDNVLRDEVTVVNEKHMQPIYRKID